MTLSKDCIVFPGHGAGSPCGKKISSGTYCTIGNQLKNNYALQEMTREAFIADLTQGIPEPPQYFFHDVMQNKSEITPVDDVVERSLNLMSLPS